jgi:hypothetical protein
MVTMASQRRPAGCGAAEARRGRRRAARLRCCGLAGSSDPSWLTRHLPRRRPLVEGRMKEVHVSSSRGHERRACKRAGALERNSYGQRRHIRCRDSSPGDDGRSSAPRRGIGPPRASAGAGRRSGNRQGRGRVASARHRLDRQVDERGARVEVRPGRHREWRSDDDLRTVFSSRAESGHLMASTPLYWHDDIV